MGETTVSLSSRSIPAVVFASGAAARGKYQLNMTPSFSHRHTIQISTDMRANFDKRQTASAIVKGDKALPIVSYLRQGEVLLWSGQPNLDCYQKQKRIEARPAFIGSALMMWVISLISLFANGFCSPNILGFTAGWIILLCFNVIGKSQSAPKWWYAVTDQRIMSDYPTEDAEIIWQLSLANINKITLKKNTQITGTIHFNFYFLHQKCVSFECIDEAETVYKIIADARKAFAS